MTLSELERLVEMRKKHEIAAELRDKGEKYNYQDYLDSTEYFKLCFMIGVMADNEYREKNRNE